MKIYIVTSGCYSDYDINAVFTVKEKAEEYLKYNEHHAWDGMRIEEYDTSDDYVCEKYMKVECVFIIGKFQLSGCSELNATLETIDTHNVTEKQDTTVFGGCWNFTDFPARLCIKRSYKEGLFTEEEAKNKVLKIGQDLCTKIKALYELEGYDFNDIKEYIDNEVE